MSHESGVLSRKSAREKFKFRNSLRPLRALREISALAHARTSVLKLKT
jgi:hypothetical protein